MVTRAAPRARPRGGEEGHRRHRDGHDEHPAPGVRRGHHPGQQHPGGPAGGREPAPDRHGTGVPRGLRVYDAHQRHRGRYGQCGTGTLGEAGHQQHPQPRGHPRQRRTHAEHAGTEEEHAPVPVQVGQPAAQQQQPAERHAVGGREQGEFGAVEPELALDVGEYDVEHAHGEDEHELDRRQQGEGRATAAVACRSGSRSGRLRLLRLDDVMLLHSSPHVWSGRVMDCECRKVFRGSYAALTCCRRG